MNIPFKVIRKTNTQNFTIGYSLDSITTRVKDRLRRHIAFSNEVHCNTLRHVQRKSNLAGPFNNVIKLTLQKIFIERPKKWKKLTSSAYFNKKVLSHFGERSSITIQNNSGPIILPCGTPLGAVNQLDITESTRTHCCLAVRKSAIQRTACLGTLNFILNLFLIIIIRAPRERPYSKLSSYALIVKIWL